MDYYYIRGLKQSLVAAKTLQKTRIQGTIQHGRYHAEWYLVFWSFATSLILFTRCVSHTVYLAHGNRRVKQEEEPDTRIKVIE